MAYGADGAVNPALGARGGLPGGACRHFKRETDGELTELPALGVVELRDGERIVSITCGGGGYGPPAEREPLHFRVPADDAISRFDAVNRAGLADASVERRS